MPAPSPEPSKAHFVDPSRIQTRIEFVEALKRLHDQSGKTFREVSRHIELSYQAVHGYVNGKHLPHARGENGKLFAQLLRTGYGIDDPAELEAWSAALDRVATAPGPRSADETVPYPGLRPFRPDERAWFFGREELTERIRGLVGDGIETGTRSMLLVGPSGSGKSSLVNVAVVAMIEEDERFADWTVERITPGPTPAKTLAAVLEERGTEPRVIVVDQMEELWSEEVDPAERMRFLKALKTCAEASDPEAFVVVVMRADFYERILRYRFLTEIASDRQIAVGPMNTGQLTAAIERPARVVHTEVEPDLTARLLSDLDTDDVTAAGTLPLLALALRDLWGRGRRGSMSAADYRRTGGLADIVKRTAERTWNELAEVDRPVARELLTHMVGVQEGLPLIRRHLTAGQLEAMRGADADVERVAGLLIESRLVVLDSDGLTLAHDVILRAWPRLTEWIEADQQRLAARNELWRSVGRWQRHGRDSSYLYPRRRLVAIEEQLGSGTALSAPERAFLESSRNRAERAQRLRRMLTAALAVLLTASLVSTVIALDQHSQALTQRLDAESRMIANISDELWESDPAIAAQFAVAAYETSQTLEARSSLLSATAIPVSTRMLGTQEAVIERIAISPEGDLLAAAADTGNVWVWDVSDPFDAELLVSHLPDVEDTIRTVRFAEGARLYSAGDDGTIYLHDFSDRSVPSLVTTATGPNGQINFIEIHPASGTVAVGGLDTFVWLWSGMDLTDEPTRLAGTGGSVKAISFAPDGSKLAIGSYDGRAAVLDLADDAPPLILDEGYQNLMSIAFSPDGTRVAAGTSDGEIPVWDTTGAPELLTELAGPANWTYSVVFLPGTPFIASGSTDGLWLWNYESGALPDRIPSNGPVPDLAVDPDDGAVYASYADGSVKRWQLPGSVLTSPTGVVRNLQFLKDGSRMAVADNHGSVWLWDVAEPGRAVGPLSELRSPDADGELIAGVAGNADGTLLAVPEIDGRMWVWNLTDPGAPPMELSGLGDYSNQSVFSPDGTRLAAVDESGYAGVWDLGAGTEASLVQEISPGAPVYAVAFAPGGDMLVTGTSDAAVEVWDATGADELVSIARLPRGPTQAIGHVAFSPDGSLIAAASDDGNVYLWSAVDLAEPPEPMTLTGNGASIQTVSFSPDGRFVSGASYDGSAIVWSLTENGTPDRYAVLTGSGAGLVTAEFSPDGKMIAGAGDDPSARIWLTDPGAAIESICSTAGVVITREEWERHVPGVEYRPPC